MFVYIFRSQIFEKNSPFHKIHKTISILLISILTTTFILSIWKWYTSLQFLFMVFFLGFLRYKSVNLSYYYLTYLLILPFFFLSNGILTGTGIVNEVVWYNNTENLMLRIGTIPIEDIIYGMLLIFLNIYIYQRLKMKKRKFITKT